MRLVLAALGVLALVACGGGTPAEGDAAVTPAPREQGASERAATVTAVPSDSADPTPATQDEATDLQAYLDAACRVSEVELETNGDAVAVLRAGIARLTTHRAPAKLRRYTDAVVRWSRLVLEDLEDRDPGEGFDGWEPFTGGAFGQAWEAVAEAQAAMDPELARAVREAGC